MRLATSASVATHQVAALNQAGLPETGRPELTQQNNAGALVLKQKIAIFVSYSGSGGVERVINNLCDGFLAEGHPVDLLLVKARGPHMRHIPPGVNIVKLPFSSAILCLPALVAYLLRERPPVLLSAKKRANLVALVAKRLTLSPTRLVIRMETHLSESLAERNPVHRLISLGLARLAYRWANHIIAVSEAAADDLAVVTGLGRERISMIANPAIPPNIEALSAQAPDHPWLLEKDRPVLLAVGRLTPSKDLPSLLRAFALVRAVKPVRLIILGEGECRASLEALADQLAIRQDVSMPGFRDNPYCFMARCDLLALSSLHEGLGMVLVEALALGTPVVATDCKSGPREITRDGRFGRLVPLKNPEKMAAAILDTLESSPEPEALRAAVAAFTTAASVQAHLQALGLAPMPGMR